LALPEGWLADTALSWAVERLAWVGGGGEPSTVADAGFSPARLLTLALLSRIEKATGKSLAHDAAGLPADEDAADEEGEDEGTGAEE
jgi:hypothetical protein